MDSHRAFIGKHPAMKKRAAGSAGEDEGGTDITEYGLKALRWGILWLIVGTIVTVFVWGLVTGHINWPSSWRLG